MGDDSEKKFPQDYLDDMRGRLLRKNAGVREAEVAVTVAIEELKAWKAIYSECVKQRGFEIAQLIQRNNFFMIFQGVLFAGICQSAAMVPVVSMIICLVGLSSSLFQAAMAAGAKYWQEHWEVSTREAEIEMTLWLMAHRLLRTQVSKRKFKIRGDLLDRLEMRRTVVHLFEDNKNREKISKTLRKSRPWAKIMNIIIMMRFSASRIPVYVGLAFAVAWFVLFLCTFRIEGVEYRVPSEVTGFPITELKK